jgi:hypothetical protein
MEKIDSKPKHLGLVNKVLLAGSFATFVIYKMLTPSVENVDFNERISRHQSSGYLAGDIFFHSRGELSDGVKFGKMGAMEYILGEDGKPMSYGFHSITPTENGYHATYGACEYTLDKSANVIFIDNRDCAKFLKGFD